MACFIVPAAEAIAVTAATKLLGHKKAKKNSGVRTLFVTEKLGWLNKMLWGGSALLAFEGRSFLPLPVGHGISGRNGFHAS